MNPRDRPRITSQTPLAPKLSYSPQNTELSSFSMISMGQAKVCQHNVDWKLADMQRQAKHCAVHTNSKLARKKERAVPSLTVKFRLC